VPGLRHSHDLGGRALHAVQPDPLPDRIPARPIRLRKLLVHNRHRARSGPVVVRESAPAFDFDTHGAEVTGVHGGAELDRFFAALRELVPFGHDRDYGLGGRQRQRFGQRHRRHAGHGAHAIHQPAVEGLRLFGRVVQHGRRRIQADQMVRAKLGRQRQHVPEARQKHSGGDRHHHRQRDLAGYQNVAPERAPRARRAVSTRLQCAHEIRPRRLPGRSQAEEDTTPERREHAELHHAPIQLYAQHIGWIAGHAQRLEQQNAAVGEK
jgi:hypothetical protein